MGTKFSIITTVLLLASTPEFESTRVPGISLAPFQQAAEGPLQPLGVYTVAKARSKRCWSRSRQPMESFARHFRQESIADVDLVIRASGTSEDAASEPQRARGSASAAAADTAAGDQLQLAVLPAHKIILFNSEYFEAQVCARTLVSTRWLCYQSALRGAACVDKPSVTSYCC